MKWLSVTACVGVCVGVMCLPAWATTSTSKKHKSALHIGTQSSTSHRSSPAVKHANATTGRSEAKSRVGLRTAKYTPADTPQSNAPSSSKTKHPLSKKKSSKTKRVKREPTQMAPTTDRISEIQTALGRGGYYKSDPNGKWDADTMDAVQKFQSANGLDANGKLDALTLQKLGLGSDVAGVSSPKGIVPHSCCSISPSPSYAPPASATPKSSPAAQAPTASATVVPPVESSQK
jgi:hypothetical protein